MTRSMCKIRTRRLGQRRPEQGGIAEQRIVTEVVLGQPHRREAQLLRVARLLEVLAIDVGGAPAVSGVERND